MEADLVQPDAYSCCVCVALLACVPAQVCLLLQRMGLDASDTRPLKKANLSGAELLLLSEQQLVTLLDLPMHKAHRLMRLQVRTTSTHDTGALGTTQDCYYCTLLHTACLPRV